MASLLAALEPVWPLIEWIWGHTLLALLLGAGIIAAGVAMGKKAEWAAVFLGAVGSLVILVALMLAAWRPH